MIDKSQKLHEHCAHNFLHSCIMQLLATASPCVRACGPNCDTVWLPLNAHAGIANSFVGAVLMHDLKSMPWPAWLVPMCLLLGINVLLGLGLEVAKLRVRGGLAVRTSSMTWTSSTTIIVGF